MNENQAGLRVTLKTSDGRTGTIQVRADLASEVAWDGDEGDGWGETVLACFEVAEPDGAVSEKVEICGDDWRRLEDAGRGVDWIWWASTRGAALAGAVSMAVSNEDEQGFDSSYEEKLAEVESMRDGLMTALTNLTNASEALVEMMTAWQSIHDSHFTALRAAIANAKALS